MWASFFGSDEASDALADENPAQDAVRKEPYVEELEDSPISMLLKRMNQLLVQVGELEFEKKSIAEKAAKDISSAKDEIVRLRNEIDDLNAQNEELVYQCEATSDPVLLEQMQDLTDMRDALLSIRNQLENELEQKEEEIMTMKEAHNHAESMRMEGSGMFFEDIRSMVASEEAILNDLCGHLQLDCRWTTSLISSTIREVVNTKSSISSEKDSVYLEKLHEWEVECERYKSVISELEQNIATQSEQADAEAVTIRVRNADLEREIDAVRQAHAAFEDQLKSQEKQLICERAINEGLNQQLSSFSGNVAAILGNSHSEEVESFLPETSKSDWLENAMDTLKEQLITKEEELCSQLAISAESMTENVELQQQVEMLQSALLEEQQSSKKYIELEKRVIELLEVIVSFTANVGAEQDDWEGIKNAVLHFPSDGIRLHIDRWLANHRSLQSETRRLTDIVDSQAQQMQKDHERITQLQIDSTGKYELAQLLEDSMTKVKSLQESENERSNEMVEIEKALAASQARNEKVEQSLSTLETELDTLRKSSANQIQELSDANLESATALKTRAEEIKTLESFIAELNCQLEQMSCRIETEKSAALEVSQKGMEEELEAVKRCLETEKSRNSVLAAEFDSEKKILLQRVSSLEVTLNEKENLHSKSLEQLGALQDTIMKMEGDMIESKIALDLERKVSLEQIHQLEAEMARKEHALQSLQASSNPNESLDVTKSEQYNSLVASYRQLETELQQSKNSFEGEKEKNSVLANALEGERTSNSERISFLEAALSDKDSQLQKLRVSSERMVEMEQSVADTQQRNTQYETEVTKLTDELNHLRGENSRLMSEKGAYLERIRLAEEEIGKDQALQITLKHQVEALQSESSAMLVKMESARLQIDSLMQQNHELEISKAQIEEVNKKNQSELHQNGREMQDCRQQARAEIQRLTNHNTRLEEEIVRFATSRQELDVHINNMQQKYNHLKAERDVLAARSSALEEQLGLYTRVPYESTTVPNPFTPDLWDLLSRGMEQLKADLEIASKHAASIDDSNVIVSEESVNA
ncbi:hypothetical protein ABG067_002782 [Albugo candida]